jgi:hypothetical protein
VTRSKLRRLHVAIDPPITTEIAGRTVKFVGLNLLHGVVMIEYDVDPPLTPPSPFGPHLLVLRVIDDTSDEVYPTAWEDFRWPLIRPGRTTTRLDRRPPPEAKRLRINVQELGVQTPSVPGPGTVELRSVVRFDVELPLEHGQPWNEEAKKHV